MDRLSARSTNAIDRRRFCRLASLGMLAGGLAESATALADTVKPTDFQIACMTLPYSAFPLERALSGLKQAGYRYVAWGTTHLEAGGRKPVMAVDAPAAAAKELANRCRDLGLEPLMMFSTIYPEEPKALPVLENRIRQASAAGIRQVLTFGHTKGGNRQVWVERFRKLGPMARDHGVMIVVKQHGGSTGTGQACAEIVREVDDEAIKVNYDAGNVMDYLDLDPLPDIKACAAEVRSFCIKDHRNFPQDQDCGPGFGEIDHYRLLAPVAWTGLAMPLCCENIFAPVVSRPQDPAGVDALARRARVSGNGDRRPAKGRRFASRITMRVSRRDTIGAGRILWHPAPACGRRQCRSHGRFAGQRARRACRTFPAVG